ncbi:MAG: glycosyltransferase family 39 protein [Acidobacteriota bacterium]
MTDFETTSDRPNALRSPALALAAIKLLMHLPFLGRFGYHHDELYFLACGQNLAWGYVDHPPLVPFLARLAHGLFGAWLPGLRLSATFAGVAAVALTVHLARRLGAGPFAQWCAGLAMLAAPVFVRTGNLLCIPAFEPLFWLGGAHLLVSVLRDDRPKLWLGLGAVAGLGLLNKHSMLFFGFGLVLALLATPHRRQLVSPWLWLGGAVAALVALPNLLWQVDNGWPTVEFLTRLNATTMDGISPWQFAFGQVMYMNFWTAPLWMTAVVAGLRGDPRRPERVFALMWVSIFLLLLTLGSKIYYLAPIYPILFAAGGGVLERFMAHSRLTWPKPAYLSALVLAILSFAPLSLPMLSIDATDRYASALTLGAFDNAYELTGDLHGQFGWPERADAVVEVYRSLTPEEQDAAYVITSWYGPAGALDYFGRPQGLPPVYSGHMSYHLWGPPPEPTGPVIAFDIDMEELVLWFESVEVVRTVEIPEANPWNREMEITICRGPKVDWLELWPKVRNWGH